MAGRARARAPAIESFDFAPGRVLLRKYEVLSRLGSGWEGEVYMLRELATGIERAGKFFFPQRNPGNRTARAYARKLHRLRHCPIVIQYRTQETLLVRRTPVTFLVSDYVEGELLAEWLARQPGRRIDAFMALHLLHALARGIECIHDAREYHGDLHSDNVIVRQVGLGFEIKLIDLFHAGPATAEAMRQDVVDLVRLLYEAVGGRRHYARQPRQVKEIVCGLKRGLILRRYRTARRLREHLERLEWD